MRWLAGLLSSTLVACIDRTPTPAPAPAPAPTPTAESTPTPTPTPAPASGLELENAAHPEMVEVRPSLIPGAGMGLFATTDIPEGTYVGPYSGNYLAHGVSGAPYTTYLFELPKCARSKAHTRIAGDSEHYISKVNFAPSTINRRATGLQNTAFYNYCEEPFIRLFSTRSITRDEEIYTDYGSIYDYAFMDRPEVQDYFLGVTGIQPESKFDWEYAEKAP